MIIWIKFNSGREERYEKVTTIEMNFDRNVMTVNMDDTFNEMEMNEMRGISWDKSSDERGAAPKIMPGPDVNSKPG